MVEAFADRITPEDWLQFPSRVETNTRRVLDLFSRHAVRATFFVVGWTAKRFPHLVREILTGGHEIGCHSHMHRAIWHLTPDEFRADLKRAIASIEDVTGTRVVGFRAPTFSIVRRTLWALEILAEEGVQYDSSVFPVRHDAYGIPTSPRKIFRWRLDAGELYEFPMTTARVAGMNLPAAGGGYLRLLPLWFNQWAIRGAERAGIPANVYFHPWEMDPDQPRIAGRWKSRVRHYTNLKTMETRLATLLNTFRFVPLSEALQRYLRQCAGQMDCVSTRRLAAGLH